MADLTRTPLMGRADRLNAMAEKQGERIVGTIPADSPLLKEGPQGTATQWSGPSGNIDLNEGPPPWELEDKAFADSDARRYVDVPDNWTLYWINPRMLESSGWRYWKPVTAGTPGVKVKVEQMLAPDGNIRRGGERGDILAWMYTSWRDSLRRKHLDATQKQTQTAVDKAASLKDDFNRGKYGPYVHLDSVTHPTHTGASIKNPTD
jgi:hypothetical protein